MLSTALSSKSAYKGRFYYKASKKSCKFLGFTLEPRLACPHFLIQAQGLSLERYFYLAVLIDIGTESINSNKPLIQITHFWRHIDEYSSFT